MSAKLTQLIPSQNFEAIRDAIAAILTIELTNQQTLMQTPKPELNPKVWVERFLAFDDTQYPAINVYFAGGKYSNEDMTMSEGEYVYHIYCVTGSKATESKDGDELASINLHKILGMCRAILKNQAYKTLGFSPSAAIKHLTVSQITMSEKAFDPDTKNTASGWLELRLTVPEFSQLATGTIISEATTVVKLNTTNKGYYYEYS